jgi:hypothetical protein
MQMKLLGITNVDINVTDQQLIKLSISGRYRRNNGSIMVQCISGKPTIQLGGKYYTIFSLNLEYPGN